MKKFLQITILFFCVCFVGLISSQNLAAQTTWTGSTSTDWNNTGNWTNGVPSATVDVIIPSNCTRYPVLSSGNTCRNIYMAAGARMQNQHLLTYTKAFVDISVNTNRYVRITPPLKETYSGDFFTKEQGGEWSEFTPAQYKPTDGPNGKNRIHPGGTYQSLFSETSTQRGNYGETAVSTFTSGWADPKNALNTKYKALQALDVWVDTKEDGVATFHFPSQETTYYYYDQNGKKQSFGETTPRTAESGRFVYDNAYANGVYDIEYDRSNNANDPAFALGNPAMAYLDIREFLRLNGGSNITPYVYRHNEGTVNDNTGGRGTETILYYNKSANKLYQVDNTSTTTGTEVPTTDARSYIAPAHACRVVSIPTEPRLIGRYSCTYSYPAINICKIEEKDKSFWYEKANLSIKSLNATNATFSTTITPDSNDPTKVIIGNFMGIGDVAATLNIINENEGTLVIANGSELKNSKTRSNYHNGGNPLRVYGYSGKTPTYIPKTLTTNNYAEGAQYLYRWPKNPAAGTKSRYSQYTQYVDPNILKINIIINYSIKNDKVELSLKENGFVIYGDNLINKNDDYLVKRDLGYRDATANSNDYLKDWSDNRDHSTRNDLEAWFVCNGLEATPRTTTQDVFILPAALGNYSVYTRFENTENAPSGVDEARDAETNYHMTIRRYGNSYDQVTISGFYPGHDSYVMGTITYDGSKYTLTIPDGQLVKKNSETDNTKNYYLYGSRGVGSNNRRTNEAITFNWDGTNWKTPSTTTAQYHAQVSLGNGQQPSGSNPGFYWYKYENNVNILILSRYSITTEDNAVGTPPPSQETTVTQVALRFTPDMFKANPTITSGASLAPRRQGVKDTVVSPVVNIRATGEGVSGNTLIVVDSTARNDYSMAEDAPLFDVQDYAFCLATLAGEQVVGVNVVSEPDIIPLYIQSQEQMLTLHFENIEALGGAVELYDALTEDSVLITPGSCSVDIDLLDSEEAGRFFLRRRVSQAPTLPEGPATELPAVKETALQAWSPMKGVAVVHAGNTEKDAQIYVIDMSGRIVHQAPMTSLHTVRGLYTGTYVIKVGTPTDYQEVKLLVE